MEPIPQNSWDAMSESAKAFANLILGAGQTDLLRDNLASYSELQAQKELLEVEVATLQEYLPFKDKYENLQKEFRKVAAERDSLSSQALKFNHMSKDYDRLKDAYQKTKGQLAALQDQLEAKSSSINQFTALETLYQGFKAKCDGVGVDIRRIPVQVFLQFQLQDGTNRTMNISFSRVSADKWSIVK
jgi:predicted RNase H-like nuclease (RuvC/YqgF family)